MLDIQTEDIEPRQLRLTVSVPPARLAKAIDEVAQSAGKQARIPGYRPGKVPVKILEQYLDMDKVRSEALRRLRDQLAREAVKQVAAEPGGPVSVEVSEDDPPVFTYLVPLTPMVDLGDYRETLRVPFEKPEPVDEDMVDDQVTRWLASYGYLAPVDRPAEVGDVMHLSLVGLMDGEEIFHEDDLDLELDSEAAIELGLPGDLMDQLVGLEAGETHAFDLTFSEFSPEAERRGQTAHFEAQVFTVSHEELPTLDDDFVQNTIGAPTVADVRQAVRAGLEEEATRANYREYRNQVLHQLAEQATIAYPPVTLDMETVDLVLAYRKDIEAQGLSWTRFLELEKKTENDLLAELEPIARHRLEHRLALEAFVAAESIDVPKDMLEAFVKASRDVAAKERRVSRSELEQMRRRVYVGLLTDLAYSRLAQIALGGDAAAREQLGDVDKAFDVDGLLDDLDDEGGVDEGIRIADSNPSPGDLILKDAES